MEGEDPQVLMSSERLSHEVQRAHDGPVIEELPPSSAAVNEERAIVLFRPVNIPILQQQSPSTLSVSVDPDLIYGFKSKWLNLLHSILLFPMCPVVLLPICYISSDCPCGKETSYICPC